MKTKLLYVEDELALAGIVKDTLESKGYEVFHVSHGNEVLSAFRSYQPSVCILDVMLPGTDGFSLGKIIHGESPDTPIIFLTAKDQTDDVVKGFRSGGRDYLKKPFSMAELIVRIESLLNYSGAQVSTMPVEKILDLGKFQLNPQQLVLSFSGEEQKLTYRELEILIYLQKHQNSIIQKKDLLLHIWGDDSMYNARNLDVYIKRMRDLLERDEKIQLLTLRGVGYQFSVNR